MKKGDICIIAPETEHAVSAFSDDCILINIILRVSTFEKAFFGVLSENDILSDFFMRTLYHSKTHPYLYFRTGDDQELFDYVLYAYQEFLGNHQYKERFLNNIISAFFIILLRNHGSDVIVPEIDTEGNDENVIFILKYMQENLPAFRSSREIPGLADKQKIPRADRPEDLFYTIFSNALSAFSSHFLHNPSGMPAPSVPAG